MAAKRLKLTSTAADESAIRAASWAIAAGEIAVVPMETVYGALARVDHPEALKHLRHLRQGSPGKAMTLHVASQEAAERYLDPPNSFARRLMGKLWPGPVTMVFRVSAARAQEVAQRDHLGLTDLYDGGEIAIRCPAHPVARAVLRQVEHPVAGSLPSDDAARADQLAEAVLGEVAVVLDDGPATHGKPSTIIRVHADRFDIVRAGVYDRRIIEKMLQTTILFVCSGNTCRSPMAEAITRKVLAESLKISERDLEKEGYTVMSAGASAFPGMPASANAIAAAAELGIDLSAHRSRPLTQGLIHQATAVFGMARSHVEVARMLSANAADRIRLLDPEGDIEDPIGGAVELYRKLALKMRALVERRLADGSLLGREKK